MTLQIRKAALDDARRHFEAAGVTGCEGTGMLAAVRINDTVQVVTRFFPPEQRASPVPHCSVEVTERGKLQLAAALHGDERWVARIHSHPSLAFHSLTDDANPALTAEGSWSIVVPFFGLGLRAGLHGCAVYQLTNSRWTNLSARDLDRWITVVDQ